MMTTSDDSTDVGIVMPAGNHDHIFPDVGTTPPPSMIDNPWLHDFAIRAWGALDPVRKLEAWLYYRFPGQEWKYLLSRPDIVFCNSVAILRNVIVQCKVGHFKIGATARFEVRLEEQGLMSSYRRLFFVPVANVSVAGELEHTLIQEFKCNSRCDNRTEGKEGLGVHDNSMIVYVSFR
jgi:hypothetical protein